MLNRECTNVLCVDSIFDKTMERPGLLAPKKRVNGKKCTMQTSHVDHIIAVQGSNSVGLPEKANVEEGRNYLINGNMHIGINGLKTSLKSQLPIITDDGDEEVHENSTDTSDSFSDPNKPLNLHKNGYQPLSTNINNSREILDLSPIYENSSDACSSHDDLQEITNEHAAHKTFKVFTDECSTPNSLSQTHSETSLEMGLLSDHSAKNSAKRTKKRVNIVSDNNDESDAIIETEIVALKSASDRSNSPDKSINTVTADGYLTMTGTIKRGKKKGQNIDVKLNISREELEVLEAAIVAKEANKFGVLLQCTPVNGFHILVFSIICAPIIFLISSIYSFYMGTITWYNIFTYVADESTIMKKIFLTPVVVLLFPFMILLFTISLGFYASIVQLTFNANTWWKEVCDLEKGFFGWVCAILHLSDCSPYEVVILTDLKVISDP